MRTTIPTIVKTPTFISVPSFITRLKSPQLPYPLPNKLTWQGPGYGGQGLPSLALALIAIPSDKLKLLSSLGKAPSRSCLDRNKIWNLYNSLGV